MFLFAWQAAQEAKAKKEAEDKAQQEAEEQAKKEAEEKSKKARLCVVSYSRFKINYCFYLPGRLLKRQRPRRRPKTRPNRKLKKRLRRKLKQKRKLRRKPKRRLRRKLKTRQGYVLFHIPDSRLIIVSICLAGRSRGEGQEGG